MNPQLLVDNKEIRIKEINGETYICLTDMTKGFDGGSSLLEKWMSNKSTIEFLGAWEKLFNSNFKTPEFGGIKNEAGGNAFFLSTKKWVEKTNAVGIISKAGKYGGTYAAEDIATHFGQWLSPEFSLYVISEFKKFKKLESQKLSEDWQLHRALSKVNYRLHTDAVQEHLVPKHLKGSAVGFIFASEADILNLALFGMTAKDWKKKSKGMGGNLRENATTEQLLVLSQLEVLSQNYIEEGRSKKDRYELLNQKAIKLMKNVVKNSSTRKLKK